ncbi:PP2C family protein-serine/threonine phosphatase [Streptomyces abyssalis]|uniref:PP2C family protein-serine/threonine phosphatase n=1 Tax=Streptomyces abyssalis TaxID=933944 RepID=UPI00085BB4FC|nr:SpoIIE family protein phosphatase [Streptomyces abyssalis]
MTSERTPPQGEGRDPGAGNGGSDGDLDDLVVSASADGIIAVDDQGIVQLVNPAATELFDRPAGDLLHARFGFPVIAGQSTQVELTQPGGGVRVVEMRTAAATAHGEPLRVVSLRDVTRRWHAEREAERFQRLLLPKLPDLAPFQAAAAYRPAAVAEKLGGDWYDAVPLPGGAIGAVIGDVAGHSLQAAAAMAQIRNMLRALLYDSPATPGWVLARLDRTLRAINESPVTTACVARIEPGADGWRLLWSNAGHPPPLLLTPAGTAEYLHTEPGLPLGVDPARPRLDTICSLSEGTTVVLFTDGLVERTDQPIDLGLASLAAIAERSARLPLDELCRTLADQHPGDGHDDIAILALRMPAPPHDGSAQQ